MEHKDLSYSQNSSADFINDLEFAYIKTYSFRRGKEYELFFQTGVKEYERLRDNKSRTPEETDHFNDLNEQLFCKKLLIDRNGEFDLFSKLTGTFNSDSQEAKRIIEILRTEIVEYAGWVCSPVYRDAIVFYDREDKIICTLNVCLSCCHLEAQPHGELNGDILTFDLLKRFFLDVGHKVEEQEKEYFFLSDKKKEERQKKLNERRRQSPE